MFTLDTQRLLRKTYVSNHSLLVNGLRLRRALHRLKRSVLALPPHPVPATPLAAFLDHRLRWPPSTRSAIARLPADFVTDYSMQADSCRWLHAELLRRKPAVVVEVGCGISTLVIALALHEAHGTTAQFHFVSLDAEEHWLERTRAATRALGLEHAVDMRRYSIHEDETPANGRVRLDFGPLEDLAPVDFLLIDAPPERIGRQPVLPALMGRLSARATIVLDDAARQGERNAVRSWRMQSLADLEGFVVVGTGLAVLRRRS